MRTKRDWMLAAMELLVAYGVDSITIEALTKRLGITKGSFYHHFQDMQHFKTEMLAQCFAASTTDALARADAGATPFARLQLIIEMASAIDPIEVAIRAWALRDAQAQATLAAIDEQRQSYLVRLFCDNGLDASQAEEAARLLYMVFIGGHHRMPPLTTPQMQALFALILDHYAIQGAAE